MEAIGSYIHAAFMMVINAIIAIAMAFIIPVLTLIGSLLPTTWKTAITEFVPWLNCILTWVPLDFGLTLLVSYYAIKATLLIIRFILKAIPGVW